MPLTPSKESRRRLHVRQITYAGWQRDDGLFDIEAHLVDAKDSDFPLASGTRAAGDPIHDMSARVTIDRDCTVQAIETSSDRTPYPGGCDAPLPDYGRLVGVNLLNGFRKSLYDAVGDVSGCTHLTELIAFLPTAALQTFAGLQRNVEANDEKPFQLDRCHALRTSTETVRRYYPKWYRAA